jgi:hypothetical protein
MINRSVTTTMSEKRQTRVKRYRPGVDPIPDDTKRSRKWDFAGPLLCVCIGCFIAAIFVLLVAGGVIR